MPQRQFHSLALTDILEQNADLIGRCIADRKREHIEPPLHCAGFAFEAFGLPRHRDPAIDRDPLVLDPGFKRAHRLADRIGQPGMADKGIIGFEEDIVARRAIGIELHLDDAEAFIDDIEQQLVARIGLAAFLARQVFAADIADACHDCAARWKAQGADHHLVDSVIARALANQNLARIAAEHAFEILRPCTPGFGITIADHLPDRIVHLQQAQDRRIAGKIAPLARMIAGLADRLQNAGSIGQGIESCTKQGHVRVDRKVRHQPAIVPSPAPRSVRQA